MLSLAPSGSTSRIMACGSRTLVRSCAHQLMFRHSNPPPLHFSTALAISAPLTHISGLITRGGEGRGRGGDTADALALDPPTPRLSLLAQHDSANNRPLFLNIRIWFLLNSSSEQNELWQAFWSSARFARRQLPYSCESSFCATGEFSLCDTTTPKLVPTSSSSSCA